MTPLTYKLRKNVRLFCSASALPRTTALLIADVDMPRRRAMAVMLSPFPEPPKNRAGCTLSPGPACHNCSALISATRQFLHTRHQPGHQWVQMNVAHQFEKVGIFRVQDRFVSVLEQVTMAPMAAVETDGVSPVRSRRITLARGRCRFSAADENGWGSAPMRNRSFRCARSLRPVDPENHSCPDRSGIFCGVRYHGRLRVAGHRGVYSGLPG